MIPGIVPNTVENNSMAVKSIYTISNEQTTSEFHHYDKQGNIHLIITVGKMKLNPVSRPFIAFCVVGSVVNHNTYIAC